MIFINCEKGPLNLLASEKEHSWNLVFHVAVLRVHEISIFLSVHLRINKFGNSLPKQKVFPSNLNLPAI